jgi:hypothetical protein
MPNANEKASELFKSQGVLVPLFNPTLPYGAFNKEFDACHEQMIERGIERTIRLGLVREKYQDIVKEARKAITAGNFKKSQELNAEAANLLAYAGVREAGLSAKANLSATSGRNNARQNANADPDMGASLNEDTVEKSRGDAARCKRYCAFPNGTDIQGKSSCPHCHGIGFNAEIARRAKKTERS